MKKEYQSPIIDLLNLHSKDIITYSNNPGILLPDDEWKINP